MVYEILVPDSSKDELKELLREVLHEELSKFQPQAFAPKANEKAILTRKEAMRLLSCSHSTLYRYQRDGEVPYFKVGSKVLFKRSELLEFIQIHQN